MSGHAKNPFEAGYLIAVANILHLHDEPGIAECVLGQLGVGREALKRVCKAGGVFIHGWVHGHGVVSLGRARLIHPQLAYEMGRKKPHQAATASAGAAARSVVSTKLRMASMCWRKTSGWANTSQSFRCMARK